MKIVSIFFLLLIGIVLLFATLNYSGMCIPQGRYLSKQEKIDAIVIALSQRIDNVFMVPHKGKMQSYPVYSYAFDRFSVGAKEVKKENWPDSEGVRPAKFIDKVTGAYNDVIGAVYSVKYNQNGEIKTKEFKAALVIQNCGKVTP